MVSRVCIHVCAHGCAHVTREISFPFQDNATLHNAYVLYTCQISDFLIMWDYFYVFMCAGDVASCRASDHDLIAIIDLHLCKGVCCEI